MADVATLVLAAGGSRRFGSAKQLAPLRGRPLLGHLVDRVPGATVVLGAYSAEIRAAVDLSGVRVVECPEWEEGQAASLRAGVAALPDADAIVVLLSDMPFVTREVIDGVAGAWEPASWDAVRAVYGGRPGHPVLLGRPVLDAVPSLHGDVGARQLLESGAFRVREWQAGGLCDPTDIDTPEQLEAIT